MCAAAGISLSPDDLDNSEHFVISHAHGLAVWCQSLHAIRLEVVLIPPVDLNRHVLLNVIIEFLLDHVLPFPLD